MVDKSLVLRKIAGLDLYLEPVRHEKMVKFRNVVVHQYEAVDAEIAVAFSGSIWTLSAGSGMR